MNLNQLRYFLKVAELQHFSRAAQELYVSQPSLTHAVKTLECELGVKLFTREGRGVKLSEFGQEFYRYVERALRELDRGVERAAEYNHSLSGLLNIGAVFTVTGDYLPPLVRSYRKLYGDGIKMEFHQNTSLHLLEGLSADRYDLVFSAHMPMGPEYEFIPVVYHQLVAVVSSSHLLAQRESVGLSELSLWTVVTYQRRTPIGKEVYKLLDESGVTIFQEYPDEISLGGSICANEGRVGVATYTMALKAFSDLRFIPIEGVETDFHPIYMVYKGNKERSRAAESFIEYVHDYIPPEGAAPRTPGA
ncbi:MAG: LysR family transcriptional regulator [Coriobacteriales bacterium]